MQKNILMEKYFHFNAVFIHLLLLLASQHLPTTAGVVYYVKPTEPCAHNSSCPFNETCHTMDHYASNSSHYFSPDHINVTLYFMCGVHNCTKHVHVRDLPTFAMIGTAGRQNVTINMPIPSEIPNDPKNIGNRTYIFANVSNMRIENATVYFISFSFEGNKNCIFGANRLSFHGYIGFLSPMMSVINITGSEATLKDCTFQNNCFVRVRSHAILTVSDCRFSSYNHAVRSAVALDNSTIQISGTVSFINNTVGNDQYYSACGGTISINSGYSDYELAPYSVFIISTGANVSFIDNASMRCGGALYLRSTVMSVNMNVNMTLSGNNIATVYNALGTGGAMYIEQSQVTVKKALLLFVNGFAYQGAAIYLFESSIFISEYSKLWFVNNTALSKGGAIHLHTNSDVSVDAHSRLVFHNNSALQGGALFVQGSGSLKVGSDSHIKFSNNFAKNYGGAIYVDDQRCLFVISNYSSKVVFEENKANESVGNHFYGASVKACMKEFCYHDIVSYTPNMTNSLSPVSSSPMRVCLCDTNGKPQCAKLSNTFFNQYKVYRGEYFSISVLLVGYDFGATIGTIFAEFIPSKGNNTPLLGPNQYHQLIESSRQCSNITYSIYSSNIRETLYLYTSEVNYYYLSYVDIPYVKDMINYYNSTKQRCVSMDLFKVPVHLKITMLGGCPPGFTLTLREKLYGCNCYPVLQNNHFVCFITDNTGYLEWNSIMWVNATFNEFNKSESDGILLARYCPLNYCKTGKKVINLGTNPNAQCDFNHAGVLCGGCENNYSLAIGSSHCVRCSNDIPLSFFIPFAVAGVLLVLFILLLNLTVTQGLINGLVFYANILWTYKGVLFPAEQQQIMLAFQIFIAWLNLDFGIETCLVVGLTAFWKTWLQFLFPLYIWFIAGVIIIVCRYSSRLTNLIGDRAVPLLATLFLLSYTKLIRTLVTIFEFGIIIHYQDDSKIIVWYLDGNLPYCQHPHIYLFLVAVAVLLFLCLPFTLFLLLIQCWRRISHLRLLRWINKFTPFYDAYFAPLKDKHHYWFGTLLLIRGALLIVFTATSSISPLVSLLILVITLVMLLFYMSIKPVYKSKLVRLFESASLSNLLVLISCTLYTGGIYSGTTALQISIGIAFVQFLLIILISTSKTCYHNKNKCTCTQRRGYNLINQDSSDHDDMCHERVNDPDINVYNYYIRDIVDTY